MEYRIVPSVTIPAEIIIMPNTTNPSPAGDTFPFESKKSNPDKNKNVNYPSVINVTMGVLPPIKSPITIMIISNMQVMMDGSDQNGISGFFIIHYHKDAI